MGQAEQHLYMNTDGHDVAPSVNQLTITIEQVKPQLSAMHIMELYKG